MANIPKYLIEKIKAMPEKPGIYQMKDKDGNIIYVGKSKTLRSRVKSYFYANHKQNKIKQMVFHIHDIDIIPTDTHIEAQILECALIKKMRPIYNKQLKNDKNYVYLKVENNNRAKPLAIVNERVDEYCIGPYRSKNRLLRALDIFQNIYPITKCGPRYKFQYNALPRSLGKEDFEKNRECLLEIMFEEECMKSFLGEVTKKMEEASLNLQYEMASTYRDMIEYLRYINKDNSNQKIKFEDREILLGEQIEDGYKLFFIYHNQIALKKKYNRLTSNIIEDFLVEAKRQSNQVKYNVDEKRELDFKKIISAEIQYSRVKAIMFVDGQYSMDQFINSLLEEE